MKKSLIKKAVAFVAVGIMTAGLRTAVMADTASFVRCAGQGQMMQGMMWDSDGNFLTREAFEERLDAWIADGAISERNRDFMLERFDWCFSYGGGVAGGYCVGFGQGGGFGGGRRGACRV